MTTYEALDFLIRNKSIELDVAPRAIFEAYSHRKIDGQEYEELIGLAHKVLGCMTRATAMKTLKILGWDEIGANEIISKLEEDGMLEGMTNEDLERLSDDYMDR